MTNTALWNDILAFNFDEPPAEYGFSTRLANENCWTKQFTEAAILEYKKFMYLAATEEMMVSPSEIVDIVWHQHLIFTQSYAAFCDLIGKQVQHIPSTHNRQDAQKFKLAKERTGKLYAAHFGAQPAAIWEYNSMYDILQLAKAKYKIRTIIIAALLAMVVLIVPVYLLLKPVYIQINNPEFLTGFLIAAGIIFWLAELFNRYCINNIVQSFRPDSFVFHLTQDEIMYLRSGNGDEAIHQVVSDLIENGSVVVSDQQMLSVHAEMPAPSLQHLQVLTTLSETDKASYPGLLASLRMKPVFRNAANAMTAFSKYFQKSKAFGKLFLINLCLFGLLLLFGAGRLVTGLSRERPVMIISIVLVLLIVLIIVYLKRLSLFATKNKLPAFYREKLVPEKKAEGQNWDYFLFGQTALSAAFIPMLIYTPTTRPYYADSSWSSGSSCGSDGGGSSCGSSCSSCGGCGGD